MADELLTYERLQVLVVGHSVRRSMILPFVFFLGCARPVADLQHPPKSPAVPSRATALTTDEEGARIDLAKESTGRLTVTIEGIAETSGCLHCALFDDPLRFEERSEPIRSTQITPDGSSCRWVVADLPSGDYALAVYHDLDGDNQLTKSALGLPREPYAFSNQLRTRFRPPSFSEACFEVSGTVEMTVELRTLMP